MKMNEIQRYFLITLGCSFVGYIICKYSFLPICKYIASYFDCDYAVVAMSLYLIIFFIIGCVMLMVKIDIRSETYYRNNFTPTKALMIVAILVLFHALLINDTIKLDKEGKILKLYNTIFTEKSDSNNKKELKNETENKANSNDLGTSSGTNGMRYRD